MSCDPSTLVAQAACVECGIPPGLQMPVLIWLFCQIQQNGVAGGTFASQQFTLNQSTWTATHGLGATPSFIQTVLVCVANDAGTGFVAGDETPIEDWFFLGSTALPAFSNGKNATNVFAASQVIPLGNEGGFSIVNKIGTGSFSPTSFNNFRLKFYARV